MKPIHTALILFLLFVLLAIPAFAAPQAAVNGTAAAHSSTNQPPITAASNSIRILSPTVGAKIGASEVTLRYKLTNPGASADSSPDYRIQLDGRDPIDTMDTTHSFTGLTPGKHTIVVELVDANHLPIGGSRAVVHFTTFQPGANHKPQITGALVPPPIDKASLPIPADPAGQLPTAAGELPLLSMVGFGALVGGVISAIRSRR